jgi:hypothetical protein
MSARNLKDRIYESFGDFMKHHRFHERYFNIDKKYFGNSIFELESNEMSLRFVIDRGDLYVDAAPGLTSGWIPLGFLLEIFGYQWGFLAGLTDLEIAETLEKEYGQIADALSDTNIAATKMKLEEWARRDRPYSQ